MPLYEYVCDACHEECEILVRGAERPICPSCGGKQLKQQLSVVAAHTQGRSDFPNCANSAPAGCALPACRGGGCAMQD
jgi:putative FmdB family regulatory protein